MAEALYDLEHLARARRLGDWMFAQFEPYVGPRVAEVGPGIGTFSERLLARGVEELLLVEPDGLCAGELDRRFAGDPRVRIVREELPDAPSLATCAGTLDFVLTQNVLEHVDDDAGAATAVAAALAPGGVFGVLVPAHPRLFGSLDRAYGHRRRYTTAAVRRIVAAAGLELVSLRPFNLLGVPGWWLKSRLGRTRLDRRSLAAYEQLVRVWRPVEERLRPPAGLSLVAIARKPRA
jgi:SAM-dependent methyltransferase